MRSLHLYTFALALAACGSPSSTTDAPPGAADAPPGTPDAPPSSDPDAAGPPSTYSSRTDRDVVPLPATIPDVGGLLGQGTIITDPDFHNRIVRATDGNTTGGTTYSSVMTADGGAPNLWSADSRLLLVHGEGSRSYVLAFDPDTLAVTTTPISLPGSYDAGFSRTEPRVMYIADGTRLAKLVIAPDLASYSEEDLFDFRDGATGSWGTTTDCLPSDYTPTWSGVFSVPDAGDLFVRALSRTGAQGTAYHVVAYKPGSGCRVLNTRTGEITGAWGDTGTILDAAGNPLADRFTMHEAAGSRNSTYVHLGQNNNNCTNNPTHCHDQAGDPIGCIAGACPDNNPYIWEVATRTFRVCGPYQCSGHEAKGYSHFATGKNFKLHEFADPSAPLTKLVVPPDQFPDMHGSWHNSDPADTLPLFAVSTDVTPILPYPCEWYDEVIGIAADGSGTVYRFAHTFNTGLSELFIVANAVGVVSNDGRFVAFTSDWINTLGTNAAGKPRGDVFIVELR